MAMGGVKMFSIVLILGLVSTGNAIPKAAKFRYSEESGIIELLENPSLRLNAAGGKLEHGDKLVLYPDLAHTHELFVIDETNARIRLQSAPNMCLNAEGGIGAGAKIVTWSCGEDDEGVDHEKFILAEDGRIRLEDHPDHCINVEGGVSQGGQLILYPCSNADDADNEVFEFKDGMILLKANHKLHFNVKGGDLSAGSPVVLWSRQAADHEVFTFDQDGRLHVKHKPYLCVNAEEGLGDGHRLILWPCNEDGAGDNEKFEYDAERNVIFSTVQPGLGFNVKEGVLASGGELILWSLDQLDHEEL